MSKVKHYIECMVEDLAKKNGYSYEYLMYRFWEVMAEDGDINYFINVTNERDW